MSEMINSKVIVTLRKFNSEKTAEALFRRITRVYDLGVRTIRFNIGKSSPQALEEMYEILEGVRTSFPEIKIILDIGYPGSSVRIELNADETGRQFNTNDEVLFVSADSGHGSGNNGIRLNVRKIASLFYIGQTVYYGDGEAAFEIKDIIDENRVNAVVMNSLALTSNQSIKGKLLVKRNSISESVKGLIEFVKPDGVALSFVETKDDILKFKDNVRSADMKVMSKIETLKGIENLLETVHHSDGIIYARGDLAFNVHASDLLFLQKKTIDECKRWGKEVYVATDILSSFKYRVFPSRADIVDLSTIVAQNATGVILNGDIAGGKNCIYAIKMIEDIWKYKNSLCRDESSCNIVDDKFAEF